jgi:hypothetical protein
VNLRRRQPASETDEPAVSQVRNLDPAVHIRRMRARVAPPHDRSDARAERYRNRRRDLLESPNASRDVFC